MPTPWKSWRGKEERGRQKEGEGVGKKERDQQTAVRKRRGRWEGGADGKVVKKWSVFLSYKDLVKL